MGYTHGTPANAEFKKCTQCGELLPNTNEFFGWAKKSEGRLNAKCKKCVSENNKRKNIELKEKNKNLSLFYDGTRMCKKCGRDLPNNKLYFSIDLSCIDGLRNVCRECSSKESGFLDPNYKASEKWTEEENNLMYQYYKDYTGEELQQNFFPNRTIRAIECHAVELGIQGKNYDEIKRARDIQAKKVSAKLKGRTISENQRKNHSEKMKEYYKSHVSYWKGRKRSESQRKQISERMKGNWAGDNNPRHINPLVGSSNGRWKGGILNTYTELRSDTKDWQNESMKFCNYSCVISGGEFDNVHHTTSFRKIVDEVFINTGVEIKEKVQDYDVEKFDLLRDELKRLHIHYGHGACIQYDIHKLFHDNYGYINTTPYDFLDFVYRIDCGEFDNWFEEHNLNININYEYINYLESTLYSLKSA